MQKYCWNYRPKEKEIVANKGQVYYPNEEDKEKGIDFAKWPPQFDVVVSFTQEIKKKTSMTGPCRKKTVPSTQSMAFGRT